jgi:hypothetical protein
MTPDFEVLINGSGFDGRVSPIVWSKPDRARTSYWKVALTSVATSREPVTFSIFRVSTYPTSCVSTPDKAVILRASDFLAFSCLLHIQPSKLQTPNKAVILSEALRRSIANRGLYGAKPKSLS